MPHMRWFVTTANRTGAGLVRQSWSAQASVCGAHPYGRSSPPRLDASDPKVFLKGMLSGFGLDFDTLSADKQAEFLDNDFLALAASRGARPSPQDVLPAMRMLCFLYCGERDGIMTDMQRCAKEIPRATFVSFPSLDHPNAFYRSDLVLPSAMTFLKSAAT